MRGTAFCRLSRMSMTEKSEAHMSGMAFCRLSRMSMTENSEARVRGTVLRVALWCPSQRGYSLNCCAGGWKIDSEFPFQC